MGVPTPEDRNTPTVGLFKSQQKFAMCGAALCGQEIARSGLLPNSDMAAPKPGPPSQRDHSKSSGICLIHHGSNCYCVHCKWILMSKGTSSSIQAVKDGKGTGAVCRCPWLMEDSWWCIDTE
jgi:hypothetical protein